VTLTTAASTILIEAETQGEDFEKRTLTEGCDWINIGEFEVKFRQDKILIRAGSGSWKINLRYSPFNNFKLSSGPGFIINIIGVRDP